MGKKRKFVEFQKNRRQSRVENSQIFPSRRHFSDLQRAPFHAEIDSLFSCGVGIERISENEQQKRKKNQFPESNPKLVNSRHVNPPMFSWRRRLSADRRAPFDAEFDALSSCEVGIERIWENEQKNEKEKQKFVSFIGMKRNSRHENPPSFSSMRRLNAEPRAPFDAEYEALSGCAVGMEWIWENRQRKWKKRGIRCIYWDEEEQSPRKSFDFFIKEAVECRAKDIIRCRVWRSIQLWGGNWANFGEGREKKKFAEVKPVGRKSGDVNCQIFPQCESWKLNWTIQLLYFKYYSWIVEKLKLNSWRVELNFEVWHVWDFGMKVTVERRAKGTIRWWIQRFMARWEEDDADLWIGARRGRREKE